MPERILNNEFLQFLTKIMIPAIITTAVAVAVDVKNDVSKVSWLTIMMSFIIGCGGAWLAGDYIIERFKGGELTLVVAIVTSLTEKTFKFIIHKLKVDQILTSIFDSLFRIKTEKK